MPRRLASLLFVAGLVLGACGSPSVATITDPKEILSRSLDAIQNAKSFHVAGDVAGSVSMPGIGAGGGAGLDLSGTTIVGDVDVAGRKAHLTLAAPALLGAGADVIVADGVTYTMLSGPLGRGGTYTRQAGGPGVPQDPVQVIADVKAALEKLTTPPAKDANERCGDVDCYHVSLKLPSTALGSIGSLGGVGGIGGDLPSTLPGVSGSGTLDVWAQTTDLRPTKVAIALAGGSQGSLSVTLELSAYDAPVSIQAPPADKIQG